MSKKIFKRQIIKYNELDNIIFENIEKATEDAGLKSTSSIYRLIKNNKQHNGFYYKFGDLIATREKYKIIKPYYILASECSEEKNPNIWEKRKCPICGREFYVRKRYKRIVCSDECHERYILLFDKEINKKRSESLARTNSKKSKETKQLELAKARKTCLERYGYEKPQQSPEYREKMSKLFKEKDWSERTRKNNEKLIPKYKKICESDNLELIEFRNRLDCTVKCKKCGNIFDVHVLGYLSDYSTHELCRKCHPNKNTLKQTKPQKVITDFLDDLGVIYEKNKRDIIQPYEIDIFIPGSNIGIEINGNFWHSEYGGGRTKEYHLSKTVKANGCGIKLIQILEDEILNKENIVKSRLKSLLNKNDNKIYARKCTISEISYNTKHLFLEDNHIDGDTISTYNYGLYYDDELVSVLTLCNRKISGKQCMEITRFANKINTNVIGGFSKLFKYFLNTVKPEKVLTYADVRWSGINPNETVYNKCGFNFVGTTTPNYYYVERNNYLVRLNRLNYTKQKLVKRGYDESKTETQIMFENNYDRIWDCGSMRFEYTSFDSL